VFSAQRAEVLLSFPLRHAGNAGVLINQQQPPSERYLGFCAYLARLLAPVWQVPINRITVYTKEEVRGFRDTLLNLLSFVEQSRWGGGDSILTSDGR
jgi:hypothetical protein